MEKNYSKTNFDFRRYIWMDSDFMSR